MRSASKLIDFCFVHKYSLIGLGIGCAMSFRVSSNMQELEKNTMEKKLFDPTKAKAQIEVYKEIYKLESEEGLTEEQKKEIRKKDGALRILQTASENDIEKINQYFEKRGGADKSEIDATMEKLKNEIESLEEVNSQHQGYKFYRAAMTKDIFEDALIELREKEFEKKFMAQKELMTGDKPIVK